MSLAIDNHGTLWMWGNCPRQSKEGGLALVSSFTPTPVWDFQGHTVVKVACGNEHVVALFEAASAHSMLTIISLLFLLSIQSPFL